jgi:hypothetical protein
MSISVGSGMPKPPVYVCHPRDSGPSVARHFGATRVRPTPSILTATFRASRSSPSILRATPTGKIHKPGLRQELAADTAT